MQYPTIPCLVSVGLRHVDGIDFVVATLTLEDGIQVAEYWRARDAHCSIRVR